MNKEKSIQADIEVLKRIIDNKRSTMEDCPQREALTSAISALEAMRDAEMPEKMVTPKFSGKKGYFEFQHERNRGINVGIDLCQPIVSKLLEDNKELQQQLHEYKLAATAEADKVDELTKENKAEIRKKIEGEL